MKNTTKFAIKLLAFVSVIGIIALLTSVNFKLLTRLDWTKVSNETVEQIILIVSAVAFSLGSMSIVIWYNPTPTDSTAKRMLISLLKVTFVLIDGLHVFIYNNEHIKDLSYWLSPIYGLQTALILFFLGNVAHNIINENSNEEQTDKDIQFEFLKGKFQAIKSKFEEYENKQKTIIDTQSKTVDIVSKHRMFINTLDESQRDFNEMTENLGRDIVNLEKIVGLNKHNVNIQTNEILLMQKNIETLLKETSKYKNAYFLHEKSRILKKKEGNRTQEEKEILKQANNLGKQKKIDSKILAEIGETETTTEIDDTPPKHIRDILKEQGY